MKTTKSMPVWAETAEGGEDQAGGGDERRREVSVTGRFLGDQAEFSSLWWFQSSKKNVKSGQSGQF
jgi:hypothetical protein